MKAAAKAAADQHRKDNEAAERREEWMGHMCNAMKAAERAKAAEQESWATKEMEWAKEKANLLDTYEKCRQGLLDVYEKCRQGLERAVRKLKEEKEKQTAIKERQRAARVKGKLKGRLRLGRGVYPGAHPSRSGEGPPRGRPPPAALAAKRGCWA